MWFVGVIEVKALIQWLRALGNGVIKRLFLLLLLLVQSRHEIIIIRWADGRSCHQVNDWTLLFFNHDLPIAQFLQRYISCWLLYVIFHGILHWVLLCLALILCLEAGELVHLGWLLGDLVRLNPLICGICYVSGGCILVSSVDWVKLAQCGAFHYLRTWCLQIGSRIFISWRTYCYILF